MLWSSRGLVPVALLILLPPLAACENGNDTRPPEVARNTKHIAYATAYPARVDRVTGELDAARARASELCGQFAGYAAVFQDPADYEKVWQVHEAADRSGKSGDYVERARDNRAFSHLLEENDGEVGKAVTSGVYGAAQHDHCPTPGNVAGAARAALKRGVDKRMETRLREANEAHRIIERDADALGKKNLAPLEKQADEIAEASYAAHVLLPELRHALETVIDEHHAVASTLDRQIADERERLEESDASDADKKAGQARIKQLEAARQEVAQRADELEERRKGLEELGRDIDKVRSDCEDALDALEDAVGARGSAQTDAPGAGEAPKGHKPK